jgi:hypothetical protein
VISKTELVGLVPAWKVGQREGGIWLTVEPVEGGGVLEDSRPPLDRAGPGRAGLVRPGRQAAALDGMRIIQRMIE